MQIKVKNTRMHIKDLPKGELITMFDLPSPILVAEGKLVLIRVPDGECKTGINYLKIIGQGGSVSPNYHLPIIISETEKIEVGDKMYVSIIKSIETLDDNAPSITDCYKILALPEHFSPKHLQAIVGGKMKDGDKVLVECEKQWDVDPECPTGLRQTSNHSLIKLNSSNHITLHKVEEKMIPISVAMEAARIAHEAGYDGMDWRGGKFIQEWFEQNVK